ncbi:hypothetical protein S245_003335, partial [Arachis hypogaea]
ETPKASSLPSLGYIEGAELLLNNENRWRVLDRIDRLLLLHPHRGKEPIAISDVLLEALGKSELEITHLG